MQDSPFIRERRQIIDKIGSFFSNLFSPDDYVEEVKKVDIALSEYGEWPWQVSLRVRDAPGNDGQAVLGDRQASSALLYFCLYILDTHIHASWIYTTVLPRIVKQVSRPPMSSSD